MKAFIVLFVFAWSTALFANDLPIEVPYPGPNTMVFCSPAGDYIGAGKTTIYTEEDAFFNPKQINNNYKNGVEVQVEGDARWSLDFVAPKYQEFKIGKYENGQRHPFQNPTKPGLSISGDGRGCNRLSGDFEVLELEYNDDGSIEKLAIDFSQRCEETRPALTGSIRVGSDIGINLSCFQNNGTTPDKGVSSDQLNLYSCKFEGNVTFANKNKLEDSVFHDKSTGDTVQTEVQAVAFSPEMAMTQLLSFGGANKTGFYLKTNEDGSVLLDDNNQPTVVYSEGFTAMTTGNFVTWGLAEGKLVCQ